MRIARIQSKGLRREKPAEDAIGEVVKILPKLPNVIRYYDEFNNATKSIQDPINQSLFEIEYLGSLNRINFTRFGENYGQLLKHIFLFLLSENAKASTAAGNINAANHLAPATILDVLAAGPLGIAHVWVELRSGEMPFQAYVLVKAILRLLCRHRLQGWGTSTLTIFLRNSRIRRTSAAQECDRVMPFSAPRRRQRLCVTWTKL